MIEINGKKYRNIKEQREYLWNRRKLLYLIYDYMAEGKLDKVRNLLSLNGFDSVEELEDRVKKGEIIFEKALEDMAETNTIHFHFYKLKENK